MKTIGFLLFNSVTELDFVGPWEIFAFWGRLGGPSLLAVAETLEVIRCDGGLTVVPHHDFNDCPPLDMLVVPGGPGTRQEVTNPAIVKFYPS